MRRNWILIVVAISVTIVSEPALSLDFEANLQTAIASGSSEEGVKYDRALGEYFFGLPGFTDTLLKCVELSSGSESVRGYFYFDVENGYHLVLEPESVFSHCLSAAFDGKSPPNPPQRPYLNPFRLGVDPRL